MIGDRLYFHWIDWIVFVVMLCVSPVVGIWYYSRDKRHDVEGYLLGGRSMKLFPIACSLMTGYISGLNLLGTSAEIYNFGTELWMSVFSLVFAGITVVTIYLPVFYRLGFASAYEYLEVRFSKEVRKLISVIFFIDMIFYESVIIHASSLALSQVTGINVHLVASLICGISVFYTVMGGIRAIVSTDAIQISIMIVSAAVVIVLGTYEVGGPGEVWKRADKAKRIEFFNFDPSPYIRHSFWTVLIGAWVGNTGFISVNQSKVQRYRTLPTENKAKLAICLFICGITIFITLACWCGLVMLASWSPPSCDPRASGLISADDQMLPAFVMKIAGHLHGIPGLFSAGVLGGALSTFSMALNSTSIVLLEDFVKGWLGFKPNEKCAKIFVKSVAILLGLVVLALTFVVSRLGGVLAIAASMVAVAASTSFGVFTLGMLFPWVNSEGAFVGAIAGYLSAGWASLGANYAVGKGYIRPKKLPVDLSFCTEINATETFVELFRHQGAGKEGEGDDVFPLYQISYHLIGVLGFLVVIVVGNLVAYFTGPKKMATVKRELFSPVIHRWLPADDRDKDRYQELKQRSVRNDSAIDTRETDDFLSGEER